MSSTRAGVSGAIVYGITRIFGEGVTGPLVVLIGGCAAFTEMAVWLSRRRIPAAAAR